MAKPIDSVAKLVQAINEADLTAAVALYEPNAVLVVRPGQLARGTAEIRDALAGFVALKATLRSEAQQVLEADNVALTDVKSDGILKSTEVVLEHEQQSSSHRAEGERGVENI